MKYFTRRLNKAFKASKLTLQDATDDIGEGKISLSHLWRALKGQPIKNKEMQADVESWIRKIENKPTSDFTLNKEGK